MKELLDTLERLVVEEMLRREEVFFGPQLGLEQFLLQEQELDFPDLQASQEHLEH